MPDGQERVSREIEEQFRALLERHKVAEEAMRASEERYRAFFELNAVGACEVRLPGGQFIRVNDALCAITGYSRDELQCMSILDPVYGDDLEEVRENVAGLVRGDLQNYDVDRRIVRKDGDTIWIHLAVSVGPRGDASPDYALGIIQDITERRRAEEALEQMNQRYKLATSAGRVIVWDWDGDSDTAYQEDWSDVGKSGVQLHPSLRGQRFIELLHRDDRERVLAAWDAVVSGEMDGADVEYRITWDNGSMHWMQNRYRVLTRRDGRASRILGSAVDITDRKNAEQALERLTRRLLQAQDEERRRIAQGLHEQTAQALVASNLNLADYLYSHPDLDQEDRDRLQESLALGEQALGEIRSLSYVLQPPLLDELGLASALSWFVDGFRRRSGIDVELHVPEGLDRLPREVEIALYRIVQESLQNILQHSGSAWGAIRLTREERSIILKVEDHGHGIESATPSSSERLEVRGVGIVDMRQRLRQLGGQLDVHSDPAGTTITAVVPLADTLGKGEPAPAQRRREEGPLSLG